MARKAIRSWRVLKAEPSGLLLWFDPMIECPRLYELEPPKDSGVLEYCEGDDFTEIHEKNKQMFLFGRRGST